ncbi:hydrogenase maturation protease [Kitasatospora sp. NPDC001095]
MTGRVVVIGVGNSYRRDDGAGPAVVEALSGQVPQETLLAVSDGEPGRMLDHWTAQDRVIVVETVHAHPGNPGRLHTLDADATARCASGPASSHGLGLGETVALAVALDRMPLELVVHAVEGEDFGLGPGLSAPVQAALPDLVNQVATAVRLAHRRLRSRLG